jgi:hypothetical protein
MFDVIKINNLKVNFGNIEDFIFLMNSKQMKR